MTSGKIDSISPDWRGDTLAAAVDAADDVLTVIDVADFDEDDTGERWLTIDGSDPMAYVAVDDDTNTVTLAAPAGVDYEAGLPVLVYDPTVPGGASVVEYEASVITDRGPVPATIPHEKIPLAGVDNLIGASVSLAEDDSGAWFVDQVLGREAVIDPDSIATPYCFGTILAATTIPDAAWTDLTGFLLFTLDFYTDPAFPGHLFAKKTGVYLVSLAGQWYQNASGRRAMKSVRHTILGSFDNEPPDSRSAESTAAMSTETNRTIPLHAGDHVSFQALQSSGAGLDLIGGSVTVSIARVGYQE